MSKRKMPMFRGTPDHPCRRDTRAFVNGCLGSKLPRTSEEFADIFQLENATCDEVLPRILEQLDPQPACSSGCAHCCRMRVGVGPVELLALAAVLEAARSTEELERLAERLRENLDKGRTIADPLAYARAGIPCALLTDAGTCSVYDARPMACRGWNSASAEACKKAIDPESVAPAVEVNVALLTYAQAIAFGFEDSFARFYGPKAARKLDLQAALLIALTLPRAHERWMAGEDIFATAVTRGPEHYLDETVAPRGS